MSSHTPGTPIFFFLKNLFIKNHELYLMFYPRQHFILKSYFKDIKKHRMLEKLLHNHVSLSSLH